MAPKAFLAWLGGGGAPTHQLASLLLAEGIAIVSGVGAFGANTPSPLSPHSISPTLGALLPLTAHSVAPSRVTTVGVAQWSSNKGETDGPYACQPQVRVRFQPLEHLGTPHLRLEACRNMPQHSKCFLGTVRGGGVRISTPNPPSRPPTVFELVFVQLEIFGKAIGTAGAQEFFPGTWYGVKLFFPPYVCILKMLS